MLTENPTKSASSLRDRFPGSVAVAGDEAYDAGRGAFNVLIDQRPDAVATPGSAAETAEIVVAAREAGLRIAPQGSSHNAAPLGSLEGTLLVKLGRMTGVDLDAENGVARVEAGARWWDLLDRASEAGLAARHGSSPEINITGYTLGGGVGWMARRHGLAANAVTSIEIVTADGELRTVDADNDPDLFWALRGGGGGNFGVVTALEFGLVPIRDLHAGALFFPFERAAEVLAAYREWTRDLPEEITSIGRTLQVPDLPVVPDIVRGKSFAIVEAVHLGGREEADELLAPLRELGPGMDTFDDVPPAALQHLHMDPQEPVPSVSAHTMLGELTERAIGEALDAVGPGAGSPAFFEIRHIGGELSRSDPAHGALDTLPGEYMMFGVAPVMDPAQLPGLTADMANLERAFAPDSSGHYANFTEVATDPADLYAPGALSRLREVRETYDPEGLFRANHAI